MSFGGRLPSGQSPYQGQQQHHPQYATQADFYQQQQQQQQQQPSMAQHQMQQQPAYAQQHQGMPSHAPQQQQQHMSFSFDSFSQQHAPMQSIQQAQVQQAQQQQWGGFYDASAYGNGVVGGMGQGINGGNVSRSGSLGDIGGGGMHLPMGNEHYLQSPTMWQQQQIPAQATVQQLAPSPIQRHQHQQPTFQPMPSPQQVQQSIPSPHQFSPPVQIQPQPPRPRPQINNQRRPSQPLQPQMQPQLQPRQHAHMQSPVQNTPQLPRASPQMQQQQHYYQQPEQSPGLPHARLHIKAPQRPSPSQSFSEPSPSAYEDNQINFQPQVRLQPKPSPQLHATAQRRLSHTPPQPRQQLQQTPPEPFYSQPEPEPEPEVELEVQPPLQPPIQAEPEPEPESEITVEVPPLEPLPLEEPLEHQYHAPAEPQFQFVNLQDIQQIPFSISSTFPTPQSLASPLNLPSTINTSITKKNDTDSPATTPVMQPKSHPAKPHQQSPRKSASQSPAMSVRKVSKSPAISAKASPYHTPSLLVNLAEEFIGKARQSVESVASTLHEDQVEDYQKLIGTGLACLDSALQSQKLSPRQEAQVRIRYATILHEETENVMDTETTLTKGITLCDKHRMFDLKYYMQYLMMKTLFLRNKKAALRALDQHIKDCVPYEHYSWYYAFRLLKASFHMESGNSADQLALDNLRQMQQIAAMRGDAAICVFASLTEALILLKSAKSTHDMIQERIAQAAKYQCDPSVNIPQLELLSMLIGLLSSLHERNEETAERLRAFQKKIDAWQGSSHDAQFMLPFRRDESTQQIISTDTSSIVRLGDDGGNSDFLVMSFMTKMEFASLGFSLGGLVRLHKPSLWGRAQALDLWREGLKLLAHWDDSRTATDKMPSIPLSKALKQRNWRIDSECYLHLLLGLFAASQCSWDTVNEHKTKAENLLASTTQAENIRPYLVYLNGVFSQGTGDFDTALTHYRDDVLSIDSNNPAPVRSQRHLGLLAGMSQLWLMQHPSYQNHRATNELISEMDPLCQDHVNVEIQGAWACVLASVVTHPPRQRNQRKEDASKALSIIKGNALATVMGLVIARDLLYNNVLGPQALSCMQAANVWATRSGSPLWQSVVGGIMAETAEAKNERENAVKYWEQAVRSAQNAFSWSSGNGTDERVGRE